MIWLPQGQKELEKDVLNDISINEAWRHFVNLVELAPRLAGTANERKQVEYYRKNWAEWGIPGKILETDVWTADGPTWGPEKSPNIFAEAIVTFPEKKSLECTNRTGCTSPGGVEGKIVNIGRGTNEEIKAANVKDKITICYHPGVVDIDSFPDPNFNRLNYRLLQSLGALGHINVSWRPFIRQGAQILNRISDGNPIPEELEALVYLPVIEISKDDGEYLKELMAEGPVRVRIRNWTLFRWKKGLQGYVEIPGTTEPEKFVMVMGHHDAIGGSATCNSNGNAFMLELMRVLWKHHDKLKRSVRFLFWTGHEPYDYNAGTVWYADEFWDDIRKNCITNYGVDTPFIAKAGLCSGTVGYRSRNSLQVRKFHEQVIREMVPKESLDIKPTKDGYFSGDKHVGLSAEGHFLGTRTLFDGGYWNIGVPGIADGKRNSKISPYAHMVEDTLDKGGSPDLFENPLKVWVTSLMRMCNCPVLPLEYISLAERYVEHLNDLQSNGGGKYDLTSLIKIAETFQDLAKKLDNNIVRLMKKYEDSKEKKTFKETFEDVNKALMKMSRILYDAPIPMKSLQPVGDLATLDQESSEFKALRTKIVRARNEIADAINDAIELAAQTISGIEKFYS